jgi:hypothetical protein
MMNSAVISKIEYRFPGNAQFTEIWFTQFSASLKEKAATTKAGTLYTATINFKVAKNSSGNDTLLKSLARRKAIYQLTDANGTVFIAGTDKVRARLEFQRAIDGKPGNFNGYNVTVTYKSKNGCDIQ